MATPTKVNSSEFMPYADNDKLVKYRNLVIFQAKYQLMT